MNDNWKKIINLLTITGIFALGLFGFNRVRGILPELDSGDNKRGGDERGLGAESGNLEDLKESLSAEDACPELFAQSSDEYLSKAASENNQNPDCFVGGCGGVL